MDAVTNLSGGALAYASILFLISCGLTIIFGLLDVLNIAHGLFIIIGAYTAWSLMESMTAIDDLTLRFLVSCVVASLLSCVFAVLMERVFIRNIYGDHLRQILITLGIAIAGQAAIGVMFGFSPKVFPLPTTMDGRFALGHIHIGKANVVIIGTAIVAALLLLAFLKYTRYGLVIRAGSENRAMVRALGINVDKSFGIVFGIGGLYAGLGGALSSVYFPGITPKLGIDLLIMCFVVIMLGGRGNIIGSIVSSLVVALLVVFGTYSVAPGVGEIAAFVLLGLVMLRPSLRGRAG
jgi:branched-chain amino acid transport system permease protein